MDDKRKAIQQARQIARRTAPGTAIVYHAVAEEGRAELSRPLRALFWSGLAAGLSMGFSMIAEALLYTHVPADDWRFIVSKLGYPIGFLIVVLGRQQLFTENTLTAVLPVLRERRLHTGLAMVRLWAVVLTANLLGAFLVAVLVGNLPVLRPEVNDAIRHIGLEALDGYAPAIALRAVFAGWLIALMVWLLPIAETGRIWVIIIITYIIGLGQFPHIIAGMVEVSTVAVMGHAPWNQVFIRYMLPTLVGNIVGGVLLVAALHHAQITAETPFVEEEE